MDEGKRLGPIAILPLQVLLVISKQIIEPETRENFIPLHLPNGRGDGAMADFRLFLLQKVRERIPQTVRGSKQPS